MLWCTTVFPAPCRLRNFGAKNVLVGMPGFRWEMVHNLALAKEVASTRPEKPQDWIEVAEKMNGQFTTDDKPVLLKGRGCRERMDLLLKKFKDEDSKSLKK